MKYRLSQRRLQDRSGALLCKCTSCSIYGSTLCSVWLTLVKHRQQGHFKTSCEWVFYLSILPCLALLVSHKKLSLSRCCCSSAAEKKEAEAVVCTIWAGCQCMWGRGGVGRRRWRERTSAPCSPIKLTGTWCTQLQPDVHSEEHLTGVCSLQRENVGCWSETV